MIDVTPTIGSKPQKADIAELKKFKFRGNQAANVCT
jgi:hypothetical protein